jgi:hypothetical protein
MNINNNDQRMKTRAKAKIGVNSEPKVKTALIMKDGKETL